MLGGAAILSLPLPARSTWAMEQEDTLKMKDSFHVRKPRGQCFMPQNRSLNSVISQGGTNINRGTDTFSRRYMAELRHAILELVSGGPSSPTNHFPGILLQDKLLACSVTF